MKSWQYGVAAVLVIAAIATDYTLFHRKGEQAASKGHHDHGEQSATMSDAKLTAAGIELMKAGPQILRESVRVTGILQANQESLVQVTPRFAGIVRDVSKRVGDTVAKGDLLAKVESNQSLTSYELRSPIDGTIVDRQVSLGEYVSEQKPAFVVVNLSTVWADFAIPRRDLNRTKVGDTIFIDVEDGGEKISATLSYLSPVGANDTQSGLARAVIDNKDRRLRPGLFVTGRIIMAEQTVPVAVALSSIQNIENRNIVFVREGEKFEARPVVLGARDSEYAEVKDGVEEGQIYASKNSFIIKAEIGKSAVHDD